MTPIKKTFTGFVAATTLVGGGVVIADQQIDPYTDTGTKLEISAESVTPDAGTNTIELIKAQPEVRLKKWDGQVDLGIRYNKVTAVGSRALLTDRMEWKGTTEEVHAYPIKAKKGMEDGGFEIEVVLKEKPDTNVFNFDLQGTEQLHFSFQSTEFCSSEYIYCPENVIGSYAVYHNDYANHKEGEINYGVGKLFHIYRPKAIDANGNETWGELNYENGTLSVSVQKNFLDNAVYPVRIDPTFGYTSIGGAGQQIAKQLNSTTDRRGRGFSAPEAGTVTSYHVALAFVSGSDTVTGYCAINTENTATDSHTLVDSVERTDLSLTTTQTIFQFDTSTSITAIAYVINCSVDGSSINSGTVTIAVDTGGTSRNDYFEEVTGGGSYTTLKENPWTETDSLSTTEKTMYVTYTASGNPSATPRGGILDFDTF